MDAAHTHACACLHVGVSAVEEAVSALRFSVDAGAKSYGSRARQTMRRVLLCRLC